MSASRIFRWVRIWISTAVLLGYIAVMVIAIAGCSLGAVVTMPRLESDSDAERACVFVAHDMGAAEVRVVSVPATIATTCRFAITSGVTRWANYQGVFTHHA